MTHSRFMRKVPALLLPVVLVLPAIGLASRLTGHGQHKHSNAAIVTVRPASLGRSIPGNFLGLSFGFSAITRYAGTDAGAVDPVFLQLVRNLTGGQDPVLRIGGQSTDSAWWPIPSKRRPKHARITLTPRWVGVTASVARQLGARLILGINLKSASRQEASAEASAFESGLGPNIEAFELGYKPELYPRFGAHRGSDGDHVPRSRIRRAVRSFSRAYSSVAQVVPGPLAGPAAAAPAWTRELGAFLASEPRVRVATMEAPPQGGCSAAALRPAVRAAHTHGVPLRLDEMNPVSCGNGHADSNSVAAALTALSALFRIAQTGVDGVDIQTSSAAAGELFHFRHTKYGWKGSVKPAYYGLMMFAQATPPGSRLVGVSTKNAAGIQVWATLGTDGHVRVVLVNEGSRARKVKLNADGADATLERLHAPSLRATRRIRLGGQSLGSETSTGELAGRSTITQLRSRGASYVVDLPAGSAALLDMAKPSSGPGGGGSSGSAGGPGSSGSTGGSGGPGSAGPSSTNCMSRLQPGGIYPVWTSVAACGYPAPTSLDPNGLASGGTAGVPDGTQLQNASTCSSCLPNGDSWDSSRGYLWVASSATLSNLYIPGSVVIAGPQVGAVTLQNSEVETGPGGSAYAIDMNGDSGVTLAHDWIHTTYNGQACGQTSSYGTQNIGIGNGVGITLINVDIDCFGLPISGPSDGSNPGTMTIEGSVLVSEGMSNPSHNEPIYVWPNTTTVIEGNTIVNPESQTTDLFGDDQAGRLTNITVDGNLIAGNQNNGGINVGCTAGNGFSADFGNYPNRNIVVQNNRFSNIFNVNAPHGVFLAGNTDRGPGTTWTHNYMDHDLSTVQQPAYGC